MDELFVYLESLYPLTPELRAALVGRFTKEKHRKNKTLLYTGQCCTWVAFIARGLVKTCYDIPGGHERIIHFGRAGEMVYVVNPFDARLASRVAVVTLDETITWKIRILELEAICEKYPSFHLNMRKSIALQSVLLEDHYLLLALPARERLARAMETQSWLFGERRIRQYMVANYLGIDQATVSRWRREIEQKRICR